MTVTDTYPLDIAMRDTVTITNKLVSTLSDVNNYGKKVGDVFDKNDLRILFRVFPIKQSKNMYLEPNYMEFTVHALHVLAMSLTFDDHIKKSLWLKGPDRDSQPEETDSSLEFYGWGREAYNLKLYMEQVLNMPHKIETAHLGHLPKTDFKGNEICGVSFKEIENSNLMLVILQTHPEILQKFYKFLHKISDADFVPLLKDSGADALRMINLILVTAESVRIGYEGRCHSHKKLKQHFEN